MAACRVQATSKGSCVGAAVKVCRTPVPMGAAHDAVGGRVLAHSRCRSREVRCRSATLGAVPDDRPPLFTADEIGFSVDDEGRIWPTVVIDVEGHPGIADLARVHAVEGIGDVRTTARRIHRSGTDLFLLGVALTRPVRAAFAIAFELPPHEDFLRTAAAASHLAIATTPTEHLDDHAPIWLAVDLDTDQFEAALD